MLRIFDGGKGVAQRMDRTHEWFDTLSTLKLNATFVSDTIKVLGRMSMAAACAIPGPIRSGSEAARHQAFVQSSAVGVCMGPRPCVRCFLA
jgi:hypothetical protein